MLIKKAKIDDIEQLIKLRIDYLVEERGNLSNDEESAIKKQLKSYLEKHISDDSFVGIVADVEGVIASTAFLAISERPANPIFITGLKGTILNVLTYPEYRRKGIATKVLEALIEEAKRANVSSIELMATTDGRYLYEKLGFKETTYTAMRLQL